MKGLAIYLLTMLIGTSMALAQLPTAVILGVTKDSTGAVIPGAKVTARNIDTGQTRTVVTGNDGAYRIDALPVGNYQLTFSQASFKTEIQNGLNLTVGQEAVANVTLQSGDISQSITVTSAAPLISTTTSSLGGLVDERRVADLPLNGRNYTDLTLLQPGVTKANPSLSGYLGSSGTQFSANGAPIRSNSYLLDGAITSNLTGVNGASAIGTTLGIDGILEYKVVTNSVTADYGAYMGSQSTIVSKSGTNEFHGNVFEYLRNSSLDARNYFDLPPAQLHHRLPEFRRNDYGASVGGPIKKNKAFAYLVYERLVSSLGTTNTATVLGAGCHGAAGATITLAACPQLSPTPQVTIDPVMAPFVDLYPLPNVGTTQYGWSLPQTTLESYGQARFDQTISEKDSAFVRYTIDNADQTTPYILPTVDNILASRTQFLTLAENHIFSNVLLNAAHFSFSRSPIGINSTISGPSYSLVAGLPMGAIGPSGVSTLGTFQNAPRTLKQNIFTWSDDLIYTRGHHSMKFGFTVNHYQDFFDIEGLNKGVAQFSNVANFLSNVLFSWQQVLPGSNLRRYIHFDTFGFYGMDDWRATPKLTLNMGMRYEPTTQPQEVHGIQAGLPNPATDPTTTVGLPYMLNPSLRNWSPRFGFAYILDSSGSTVIRGGFSLLYDLQSYGTLLMLGAAYDSPFASSYTSPANQTSKLTVPYVIPANATAPLTYRGAVYRMNQPHMMQYNLAFERSLPGLIGLTLAYAGSRGINLLTVREGNPVIPTGIPSGGACITPPAGTIIDLTSQFDGSATSCYLATSPRRNPAFGSMVVGMASSSSNYNALEVVANKRLSQGLTFQSSFTWSKLLDYGQNVQDGAANPIDPLHQENGYAPADFNASYNERFNVVYYLPKASSSSHLVRAVANGWWASSIFAIQPGFPFGPGLTSNRSLDQQLSALGAATDRPDRLAGRSKNNIMHGVSAGCGTGPTRAQGGTAIAAGTPLGGPNLYYDPCAYSIQPSGFLGNDSRNYLIGPGLLSLDSSVVKDTAAKFLGDSGQVEFRAEFFNILNHTNFAGPGAGVYAGTASVQNPSPTAGIVSGTATTSRQIQFAIKVMF